VDQVVSLLADGAQDMEAAQAIGSDLASLDSAQPKTLGRSLEVLAREIAAALAPQDMMAVQPRLAQVLGGIAAGFVRAAEDGFRAHYQVTYAAFLEARLSSEHALVASEARFRQLIDVLPVGFLAVKPSSATILMANRLAVSLLGAVRLEDVIGKKTVGFIQPEQLEAVRDHIAWLRSDHSPTQFHEERITLPDGSVHDIEFAGLLLADLEEPIIQVVFRDISDRKRAEAAVRESETLFRTLAETTASAIFMFSGEKNIYVNRAACDITGYSREELLAMPFWQVIRPDYQDLVRERGMDRQRGEVVETSYEVPIVAKDGTARWVQFAGKLIEYQGEQAVLGTAIDITANKLTEDALRESERKFRTLTEVTPAGILIIGPDGALYANPGIEALTGFSSEELDQLDISAVVEPESLPRLVTTLDALRAGQTSQTGELKIRTKSGELKWVADSWHVIELGGDVAWMVTGFDVTQRIEAERKLRTNAKRMELLGEIVRAGLTARSIRDLASEVLRLIAELVPTDRASITEVDAAHHSMAILAVYPHGKTKIVEGQRFRLEQWQALTTDLKGGMVYIPNLADVRMRTSLQEEIFAEGVRCYMSIPLLSRETLVGVLSIGSFRPEAYGEEEQRIALDASQRVAMALRNAQLFAELEASHRNLKHLSKQLVLVQETERRFLARELHDEIGQVLTALSISLELAMHATAARRSERLAEAQRWVEELAQRVRQLSLDLRPPMLDDLGLLPTLFWYFDRCAEQLRIHVDFDHQGPDQRLNPEIEIVVYRMVQEALTNIVRHSGTRKAVVRLWADERRLSVQVEDRGRGFDLQEASRRSPSGGLTGMRERVRQLGGQLIVDTGSNTGTCLTALIPLARE
jgi:PAS domain S-box-containing protein